MSFTKKINFGAGPAKIPEEVIKNLKFLMIFNFLGFV